MHLTGVGAVVGTGVGARVGSAVGAWHSHTHKFYMIIAQTTILRCTYSTDRGVHALEQRKSAWFNPQYSNMRCELTGVGAAVGERVGAGVGAWVGALHQDHGSVSINQSCIHHNQTYWILQT
jgi:hypothetical protein